MKYAGLVCAVLISVVIMSVGCSVTTDVQKAPAATVEKKEVARVGVILPFSGIYADWAVQAKNGLDLAIAQENPRRSIKIELVYADGMSTEEGSIAAARKLLADPSICAIIGPITTDNVNAVTEVTESEGIPVIAFMATTINLTKDKERLFRVCFTDAYQGAAMANLAREELNAKTTVIIYDPDNTYSSGLARVYANVFGFLGGTVLEEIEIDGNDSDFSTVLSSAARKNPDIVALPLYEVTVAKIINKSTALNLGLRFIGGDGWDEPTLFLEVGSNAEGSYYVTHFAADDEYVPVQDFITAYSDRYPDSLIPTATAALAFDAGLCISDAITRAAGLARDDVTAGIASIYNLAGATGIITIDSSHNADKPVVVVRVGQTKAYFFKRYPRLHRYIR